MAIGEQVAGELRDPPVDRRPAAAGRRSCEPLDEPGLLERLEVLANRGVGRLEPFGQPGRGRRVEPLEPLEDATLGIGQLGHVQQAYEISEAIA